MEKNEQKLLQFRKDDIINLVKEREKEEKEFLRYIFKYNVSLFIEISLYFSILYHLSEECIFLFEIEIHYISILLKNLFLSNYP